MPFKSWLTDLLIPLGGHGQVQPVENIVDLLALHLGVDAMSEELVARLKERWQSRWDQILDTLRDQSEPESAVSHLGFNLHDALLCQGAGLDDGDSLCRQVCKDFLTTKRTLSKFLNTSYTFLSLRCATCKPPTWFSSDSSLIFFTSHLFATMMRGCGVQKQSPTVWVLKKKSIKPENPPEPLKIRCSFFYSNFCIFEPWEILTWY